MLLTNIWTRTSNQSTVCLLRRQSVSAGSHLWAQEGDYWWLLQDKQKWHSDILLPATVCSSASRSKQPGHLASFISNLQRARWNQKLMRLFLLCMSCVMNNEVHAAGASKNFSQVNIPSAITWSSSALQLHLYLWPAMQHILQSAVASATCTSLCAEPLNRFAT